MGTSYISTVALTVFLALVTAGGASYEYNKLIQTKEAVAAEKSATENAKKGRQKIEEGLASLKKVAEAPVAFLKRWELYFDPNATLPDKVLAKTVSLAEKENVGILNKSNNSGKQYGDRKVPVCSIFIKCEGNYASLFNLIGELEKMFPTARFDTLSFVSTESGNATIMDLAFYVPTTSDLTPDALKAR